MKRSLSLGAACASSLIFVGLALHYELAPRQSSTGDTVAGIQSDHESRIASGVPMLSELHERMVSEGLSLASVDILAERPVSGTDFVDLRVRSTLWRAAGALREPSGTSTVWSRSLQPSERTRISPRTGEALPALAVIGTDLELLAIAAEVEHGRIDEKYGALGVSFLGQAAVELARRGSIEIPNADPCAATETVKLRPDPEAALLDYFTALGNRPLGARTQERASLRRQAADFAHSQGTVPDRVTGRPNYVDENDVLRQLARGVAPSALKVRRTVPIRIDIASPDSSRALVFQEESTGRTLGWVPMSESASSEPVELSIGAPDNGRAVSLYLRSLEGDFDCGPVAGEVPLMTIPYEAVAGERRADVDLSSRGVGEFKG